MGQDGIWADQSHVNSPVKKRPEPFGPTLSLLKSGLSSVELAKGGSVLFTLLGQALQGPRDLSPQVCAFQPLVTASRTVCVLSCTRP